MAAVPQANDDGNSTLGLKINSLSSPPTAESGTITAYAAPGAWFCWRQATGLLVLTNVAVCGNSVPFQAAVMMSP